MNEPSWRLGIDVGGTFNDLVLAQPSTGRFIHYKEPSVPQDPSLAVERGIVGLLTAASLAPTDIGLVVHGTTLGLNTILQRRGAKLALVVSRGNRDVFEIARSRMPTAFDFTAAREAPLVPRDLVFEISARTSAAGDIVKRTAPGELATLADALRGAGVEAVAVMLLNSYRHPDLEYETVVELQQLLPDFPIIGSAAICPEIREYERGLLAALNAYIQPSLKSYFAMLEQRLRRLGVQAPLFISTNNGGTVSLGTARERPIETILSGPASGVTAAMRLSSAADRRRLVTLDMGGTSTDMAVVLNGEAEYTHEARVGDFPIILPVVNVTAIGAGGGSAIWLDAQRVLKVGPESVGSDPGPVCYGKGGRVAAITDCYLVTGILDATAFLGGRMRLDHAAAAAVLTGLASRLGLDGPEAAALAALRVATAKMAVELSKLLAKRGLDHREFTLIAFGGAGATHAALLAREARLPKVVIPLTPGTFCAVGASLADLMRDYARSLGALLEPNGEGFEPVAAAIKAMEADARTWVAGETEGAADGIITVAADMRYPGQAYELLIQVPERDRRSLDGNRLLAFFHAEHERLYGFTDRGATVRVSTVRLSITVPTPKFAPSPFEATAGAPRTSARRVFHDGEWADAVVYRRADLSAGFAFDGPALVEQPDTTIWIIPGWHAEVESDGNLVLCPKEPAAS